MASNTIHPHLPRLAQAVTGVLCLEGIVFEDPWVVVVALVLVVIGRFAPRWSPVHWFFRRIARPTDDLEPAAPVRFSQTIAIGALGLAVILLAGGAQLVGWIVVGLVAALALLAAITGICVGCEVYRLALARNGSDGDVRDGLGLQGTGPWLVVFTAPGCARCEPVARRLEEIARPRPVTRIDLSRTPEAAKLPIRSVPAVITVDCNGLVRAARTGRLDRGVLDELVAGM